MEVLKVSARSNPNSVAGALAGVLREKGRSRDTSHRSGSFKSGGESHSYRARLRSARRNRSGIGAGIYRYRDRR